MITIRCWSHVKVGGRSRFVGCRRIWDGHEWAFREGVAPDFFGLCPVCRIALDAEQSKAVVQADTKARRDRERGLTYGKGAGDPFK